MQALFFLLLSSFQKLNSAVREHEMKNASTQDFEKVVQDMVAACRADGDVCTDWTGYWKRLLACFHLLPFP